VKAVQAEDFPEFYEQIHGHPPFPWQGDLVQQVIELNEWPTLIDVPTGLGKTSLLDIAVFLCALTGAEKSNERIGRRRTFFVVDRRIVVDQAAEHAGVITSRLRTAEPGTILHRAADRLRNLMGDSARGDLLPVVTMRGGVTWDAAWLQRPDVPGIITGTVDQVGSRLFFRGYGVTNKRWPIDAALVGTDSLILVDEAHLATALTTSLTSAAEFDRTGGLGVPRATVIQLTATSHGNAAGWTNTFDETAHLDHALAAQRLKAPKSLRLEDCTKADTVKTIASAAALEATARGARVLVVCNTIDRARAVHTQLAKDLQGQMDPLLLIGRSRQFDRETIVRKVLELFSADIPASDERAVLVATQTVEVGIDLDATALVTESAAWDSLVQRIGRVNRRGDRNSASILVVHDDDPKPPVYGPARLVTADFLRSLLTAGGGTLDVSPLALRRISPPSEALSPLPTAPLLLPTHLDAWARTAPAPVNDAPLDPYLHGLKTGVAPIAVAWRDGLLAADAYLQDVVDAIPVRADECVEVPISAVRRWLLEEKPVPASDWDNDDDWDAAFDDEPTNSVLRRAAMPDGTSCWAWAQASELRPGDLIVAPSELGGLDEYGWSPTSTEKVVDVAELAALERTRLKSTSPYRSAIEQLSLRLDDGLPDRLGVTPPDPRLWDEVYQWRTTDSPETRESLKAGCEKTARDWLKAVRPAADSLWARDDRWTRLVEAMDRACVLPAVLDRRNENADSKRRFILPVAVMRTAGAAIPWWDATDDTVDGTVHLGSVGLDGAEPQPVTLRAHLAAVGGRAEEIIGRIGLPGDLVDVLVDAARWHDLGKVDPRFQAMLHGGNAIKALVAPEPLAKSGMSPGDLQRRREAHSRSGLPSGARHEAWSHALLSAYLATRSEPYAGDADLLLHLVASHHGHARPLLPPVTDSGEHGLVADIDGANVTALLPRVVDLDHAERFQTLNQRYGRWGLALLEAIVRCADMTVSQEGS
jgi:CRISPR-associated endonuclease/helicase Cas3